MIPSSVTNGVAGLAIYAISERVPKPLFLAKHKFTWTGSFRVTGDESKTGQDKRLLKNRECSPHECTNLAWTDLGMEISFLSI